MERVPLLFYTGIKGFQRAHTRKSSRHPQSEAHRQTMRVIMPSQLNHHTEEKTIKVRKITPEPGLECRNLPLMGQMHQPIMLQGLPRPRCWKPNILLGSDVGYDSPIQGPPFSDHFSSLICQFTDLRPATCPEARTSKGE